MKDKVFGEMQFKAGMCKKENETITLWGNRYTFRIKTSNTKDEMPNEKQQQAYIDFKKNIDEISEKSREPVKKFLADESNFIAEMLDDVTLPQNLIDVLIPNQVRFFRNGKVAIIFDGAWTEDNVVVLLEPSEPSSCKVDYDWILESEI